MSAPPPPPPPPSGGGSSPKLYMTPHLAKRKDGLCPSLLNDSPGDASSTSKSYKTSSQFIQAPIENQLKQIVDSITSTLEQLVDRTDAMKKDLVSLYFQPKGCQWTMNFNPSLRADDFYMQVTCSAMDRDTQTIYVVESLLLNKPGSDANTTSPAFREAKGTFDFTALQVRKAVVACEFPEFPEGCKGRPFKEVYQLNARLKSGSFATVCRGTHRKSGRKVAIKCVLRKDLPPSDDAAIYDEVAILASLAHPSIVPLIDFFHEKDCYFIVMELMAGGDLFDRIGKKKTYSEADARTLSAKMIQAMAYCHSKKIAHCDMKPKNLLLITEEDDSFIKLADFGFAARCYERKSLTKQCGTPFFVAPEILMRHKYDYQSDMWSVGCIVFLLLSGNLPFMGRSQKELFRKIVAGKFEFAPADWAGVSEDAKDLVSKCLVLDPDNRITAQEALQHPWLDASLDSLHLNALEGASQRLKTFNARMKIRSAMMAVDWVSSLKRHSLFGIKTTSTKTPDTIPENRQANNLPI